MFRNHKKAFTLAEATITLFMLSVIVSIMIPAVTNIAPSNIKVGCRNAYNITTTTVSNLINNTVLYPPEFPIDASSTPISKGFFYTETGTKTTGTTDDKFSSTNELAYEYEAITRQCLCTKGSKLVRLFCCSLNVSTATCTDTKCDISTNNGMTWTLTQNAACTTANRDTTPYMTVEVDINASGHPNSTAGNEPDRYKMNVFYNGRVAMDAATASSAKATEFLSSPFDTKKKKAN